MVKYKWVGAIGLVAAGETRWQGDHSMDVNITGNDRGVSPVVGVVLLVGITVILAAAVTVFALGLVDDGQTGIDDEPDANITIVTDGTTATIAHDGGEEIDASALTIDGDVEDAPKEWAEYGTVEEGDTLEVTLTDSDGDVFVVWTSDIGEETLLASNQG